MRGIESYASSKNWIDIQSLKCVDSEEDSLPVL